MYTDKVTRIRLDGKDKLMVQWSVKDEDLSVSGGVPGIPLKKQENELYVDLDSGELVITLGGTQLILNTLPNYDTKGSIFLPARGVTRQEDLDESGDLHFYVV
jgi:hypothetical protein